VTAPASHPISPPAPEPTPVAQRPLRRLVVIANRSRSGVDEAVERISNWCADRGIFVCLEARTPQVDGPAGTHLWPLEDPELVDRCHQADAAICLGGDGTLLFAARMLSGSPVPLLAVNMGSVGFHTQADRDSLFDRLEDLAAGRYAIEQRMMLRVRDERGLSIVALNDVVINKPDWGHMIHVRLFVNEVVVSDVDADSLVVSTPTGSSGYNFAAGGPVLAPSMRAMVVQAICPHRSRFSPVVLESDAGVRLALRPKSPHDEALALVDGHPWQRARAGESIIIEASPHSLHLVTFESLFWKQMRDKLRWGALHPS
jgi:NAD+ kinase